MSESEPPERNRSATIQIDAIDDLELLPPTSAGPVVEGGASLPPPLPPRGSQAPGSRAPSVAPEPRSPLVYALIAVVGLAAGGLGIYLATTLMGEEPEPEPETTLEIGDIHISPE